jgi:uncharacterized protein (TIGR02118 family)
VEEKMIKVSVLCPC